MNQRHAQQYWDKVNQEWTEKANAEFSRDDLDAARQIVREYADAELRELLDNHYFGNHPAVIRFLRNIARGRR
jgi:hypothetical protein